MARFSLDTPVERRKIVVHDAVTVDLPFPPSVNNLFANSKSGRYVTQQYKDWRTNAGWKLKVDKTPRLPGPVSLALTYEEKHGRRDLDNLLKAVLDLLVEHKIIDGDHRSVVREINAKWSESVRGVRVIISPAVAARAA